MAINNEFRAALEHQQLKKQGAIEALNALLVINRNPPGGIAAFRQAILDKRAFWQGINGLDLTAAQQDDIFLTANGDLGQGAGADVAHDFTALFKLAAEKRMTLALASADEQTLLGIINEANLVQVRQKLVNEGPVNAGRTKIGNPAITIPGWRSSDQTVLTDAAVNNIKTEAKRLLLLKKISACTDQRLLAALLAAGDDNAFRVAAIALGIPAPTAQTMTHAAIRPLINVDAAKKRFELDLAANPIAITDDALDAARVNLREGNGGNFVNTVVPVDYQREFGPEQVAWVRGIYGKHYIERLYHDNRLDFDVLQNLARATDINAFKLLIRGGNNDDAFLNAAVTAESLPGLRQAAATKALSLKIAKLDDVDTLTALQKVRSVEDVKGLLANNDHLGYRADQPFREAFTNLKCVQQIIAMASVRAHVYSAQNPIKLRELLANANPDFNAAWQQFATAPHPTGVAEYFAIPQNVTRAKSAALVSLAKLEFKNSNPDNNAALMRIISAGNRDEMVGGVRMLLGGAAALNTAMPSSDALIDDVANPLARRLKAHAAVEVTLRVTKNINLADANFAAFVTKINQLNITRPTSGGGNGILGAAADLYEQNFNALDVSALIANLPEKDKQSFRANLVENLAKNYPPTQDVRRLKALAIAKDFVTFKQALTEMGITAQDWVTKESMAAVQKVACNRTIALSLGDYSRFQTHSALLRAVETLPVAKQQEILGNPEIIRSLVDAHHLGDRAKTKNAIKQILGGASGINDILLDDVVNENLHHAYASQITNAAIAKVIGNRELATPLTAETVNRINEIIRGANFVNPADHKTAIDTIALALGAAPNSLDAALGYDPGPGPRVIPPQDEIQNQKLFNADLLTRYNNANTTEQDKLLLNFLMTLDKSAVFPNASIDNILQDFRSSSTAEQFIGKLQDRNLVHAAIQPTDVFLIASLKKQITPEVYRELKVAENKELFLRGEMGAVQTLITGQQAERQTYTDLHKKITASDKKIRGDLERLRSFSDNVNQNSFSWFNPAFQATAKQNAREMIDEYRDLGKICDTMVTFYENEIALLEKHKASIPSDRELDALGNAARKTQCVKYRQELDKQLTSAREELARYHGVQTLLNGNPDPTVANPLLQRGILRYLDDAAKGMDLKFLGYTSEFTDYPASRKAALLGQAKLPGEATLAVEGGAEVRMRADGSFGSFRADAVIPPGHIRNHTIAYNIPGQRPTDPQRLVNHSFIEERGADVATVEKGKVVYSADSTLTVRSAPALADANSQEYYMAIAMNALKGLNGPPTKEKPIYISQGNKDQVEGIWLALMVLGKNNPNMKFGSDAIRVTSTAFNPSQHVSSKPILGESITHPRYEAWRTASHSLIQGMNEFATAKFGKDNKKAQDKSNTAVKGVTKHFKTQLQDGRQQVETENTNAQTTKPKLGGG